jgi:transposase InsO family protein
MAREAHSVEKKLALVLAAEAGASIKDLCAAGEVHRDTLHAWRVSFRAAGIDGLQSRSRRPLRSPNQTAADVEDEIVRLRKELPLDNGADVIGWHLRRQGRTDVPSDRTIHRVLVRRGMVVPEPQKRPKAAYRRFEFERPNECWQIDATDWSLRRGRPVTIMDVIDDHSRALIAIVAGQGPTTALALDAILAGGSLWGLPAMVLSDNGACFTAINGGANTFEATLAAIGVRTIHSRPRHPETCGKIERFHGTLKRWLGKRPLASSILELQGQLDDFAQHFNTNRRSSAGGDLTPLERHHATPSATPATEPLTTAATAPRITISAAGVSVSGAISIGPWDTSVGTEHAGKRVTVVIYGDHAIVLDGANVLARPYLDPNRRYLPSGRPRGGPRRRPT